MTDRHLALALQASGIDTCESTDAETTTLALKLLRSAHAGSKRRYLGTDRSSTKHVSRFAYEGLEEAIGREAMALTDNAHRGQVLSLLETAVDRNRALVEAWHATPQVFESWYVPYEWLSDSERDAACGNADQRRQWWSLFGTDTPTGAFPTRVDRWSGATIGFVAHGDCLHVLRYLAGGRFSGVFCIYADPPYNTGAKRFAFEDGYDQDGWTAMLSDRLEAATRLLAPGGWLWLQGDPSKGCALSQIVESIPNMTVRNQVVWAYGSSARGAKAVSRRLPANYDLILAAGGHDARMNRINRRVARTERESRKIGYRLENGQWFKTAPRGDYTDASIARMESQGMVYRTSTGTPRKRYNLKVEDGLVIDEYPLGDVWTDIPDMMHAPAEERLGFPAQKPLALLLRILSLGSKPGDWVLDPFAGTGTTAVAAMRLGNPFIVIEKGPHFGTILLPRILRASVEKPGAVCILTVGQRFYSFIGMET